jgi:hypothetical protein
MFINKAERTKGIIMSHSAEQMRQKKEAMAKSHHHMMHSTVDGSAGRDHSMKPDMSPMGNSYEESMEKGE